MRLIPLITLAFFTLALSGRSEAQSSRPTGAAALTVTFIDVEEHNGAIMVAVYDETGWSSGKPVGVAKADARSATPAATVRSLFPGRYAMKVFHDLNGDGTLNMNPFGIPTEPFAFSNDAVGQRGVPDWAMASFEVIGGLTTHSITFR